MRLLFHLLKTSYFQIIYKKTGDDGNTNTVDVTASGLLTYQKEISSLSSGYNYEIEVIAFSNAVGSDPAYLTVTTGIQCKKCVTIAKNRFLYLNDKTFGRELYV